MEAPWQEKIIGELGGELKVKLREVKEIKFVL